MGQSLGMSATASSRLKQRQECPRETEATPERGAMRQTSPIPRSACSSGCSSCGDGGSGIGGRRRVDVMAVTLDQYSQVRRLRLGESPHPRVDSSDPTSALHNYILATFVKT